MSKNVNVFISSPGDVEEERRACIDVINNVNEYIEAHLGIRFVGQIYENLTPNLGNIQDYINRSFPMGQVGIYVGILWNRMGTPTERFLSGTAEEFDAAFQRWKVSGSPKVFFYKKTSEYAGKIDKKQKKLVDDFVERYPGLMKNYKNIEEFKHFLTKGLVEFAFELSKKENESKSATDLHLNRHAQNYGVSKIYFADDKVSREADKREALATCKKSVKLIAHAGFSFLSEHSDKLYYDLSKCLERGCRVEIILTYPYSESGYYITRADEDKGLRDVKRKQTSFNTESEEKKYEYISKAPWINYKLIPALLGYKNLKVKYGDRIKLKMLSYEMAASVLITDESCFVEPYIVVNRSEKGMTTFEVKIDACRKQGAEEIKKNKLYSNFESYFIFLWAISEDFEKKEASLKELLRI